MQRSGCFASRGMGVDHFWFVVRGTLDLLVLAGPFRHRYSADGYGSSSPDRLVNGFDNADIGQALESGGFRVFVLENAI